MAGTIDLAQGVTSKNPQTRPPDLAKAREREFIEAVTRIYERYGADLTAFRRDVESDLAKRDIRSVG